MLTSFRTLNKRRQPVIVVNVISIWSGTVQLLSLLSSVCSLVLVVIIIISGVHSFNLLASKQTPQLLLQQQQQQQQHSGGNSSLPNNDNQRLIDSTTKKQQQQLQRPATNNHKPHDNLFKYHQHHPRRPHSSSSATLIEDLNDSTIKTRFGTVDGSGGEQQDFRRSVNFEQLIERLLRPLSAAVQLAHFPATGSLPQLYEKQPGQQPQQQPRPQPQQPPPPPQLQPSGVAADPHNRTTMRFFRNGKTFASIVYTNEQLGEPAGGAAAAAAAVASSSKGEQVGQARRARKLINCHLVDLEKHSSDVDVFERKYNIKTIDVEFREMMQLIDACTDIARFRSSQLQQQHPQHQQKQGHSVQLFAAALPKTSPVSPLASSSAASAQQQQQQQQQSQKVMSGGGPLNMEPQSLALGGAMAGQQADTGSGAGTDAATKHLQAPGPLAPGASGSRKRHLMFLQPQAPSPRELVSKALSRIGVTGKRLVLSEVTPSPGLVEARGGGSIREALQEITIYDTTDLLGIWRGILPGTNWCGMGDRATSYNDLGFESDIDICCRAHDFCPVRLSAFSSGYGLFNWSFYTRSHCLCDQNFLDCLQRAQSPLSAVVMRFYFTIMKTTCLHDNETIAADPSYYSAASAASHQKPLTPASISWWSLGGSESGNSMWPQSSGGSKQQQPPVPVAEQQQQSSLLSPSSSSSSSSSASIEQEHRLLLEQIKARRPIPALKLSQAFSSKLDGKPAASTKRLKAGFK